MGKPRQPSRRQAVQPAEPPAVTSVTERLDGARWFRVGDVEVLVRAPSADHSAVADLAVRLHAAASVPPAPPRATPWGEGQHDHVELAPGIRAALRITPDGDVVLLSPASGELTVTSGGTTLGLGLLEAGRRAAQVRVALIERARRVQHSPMCKRCDQPLFYLRGDQRIEARMHCPKAGKVPCIPRDRDVPRRRGARRPATTRKP